MNILFLYTRLAPYWLACISKVTKLATVNVFIVKYGASEEAPFHFKAPANTRIFNLGSAINDELHKFRPDIVYVSGWGNKTYNALAKNYRKQGIPVICGLDNQWLGTIRQKAGTFIAKAWLQKQFSHVWIPGMYQYEFAKHLGFKNNQILTNLYVADTEMLLPKTISINRRFIFLGRLVKHKGIDVLLNAFGELKHEFPASEMVLIGGGELKTKYQRMSGLTHLSFVAPDKLPEILTEGGIFVLPSRYEAWGVALHEAAAAGMPLISTHQCGAASHFIIHGYNGYKVNGGNVQELRQAMATMLNKSDEDLLQMAQRSRELAKTITQEMWCYQLLSVLK